MTCAMVTVYSSGDECRTTNGEVQKSDYTATLFKYYFAEQTDSASELLRVHLEQRDAVGREHGLDVVADLSCDVYLAQIKRQVEKTKELVSGILAGVPGN